MHITSLARLNRLARFSVVSMSTISRRIELTDAPVIVSMQQARAVPHHHHHRSGGTTGAQRRRDPGPNPLPRGHHTLPRWPEAPPGRAGRRHHRLACAPVVWQMLRGKEGVLSLAQGIVHWSNPNPNPDPNPDPNPSLTLTPA